VLPLVLRLELPLVLVWFMLRLPVVGSVECSMRQRSSARLDAHPERECCGSYLSYLAFRTGIADEIGDCGVPHMSR
jgi:hypothetical protein